MPNTNNGILDGLRRFGGRFRDLTVDGGLPGAPLGYRLRGATASGFPVTGTWKAGDLVPDRAGSLWLCTSGGTGPNATWIPTGDKPYQFRPETYGAKGDGKYVVDGAMAASNVLTSATANFTAADQGKHILVWQYNGTSTATTYLATTITAVTSSTTVTLAASTALTFTGVGVYYGSDDTAAIQAAINAAQAYSLAGNGTIAQVLLSNRAYCSGTAAPTVGTNLGNASIYISPVTAATGPKAQVQIIGAGSVQLPHWLQTVPSLAGTQLVSMLTGGSLNTTYGPTSVLGGPVNGYGNGTTYSNMHLTLKGFSVIVPVSTTAYCGIDLYGLGQATVDDVSYLPLAVVPATTVWPGLAPATGIIYGNPTYYPSFTFGLRMPADGNNAVSDVGSFTSYFTQIGVLGSEHCTFVSLKTLFSEYGFLAMTNLGGSSSHGCQILYWTCEEVRYPLGSTSSGYYSLGTPIAVNVSKISLETYSSLVWDAAAKLYGEMVFDVSGTAVTHYFGNLYAATSTGVKLKYANAQTGPIASPQAAPASTVAWPNYYYRDAWITLSATAISQVLIGTVADNIPAGATTYSFLLPSGQSYTPTYTGTLTHTVSLL